MSQGEMIRLLAAVKNIVGKENIEGDLQKILDIMVNNLLKNAENVLHSIETIKGSKVDARGVEVQGQLDPDSVRVMRTFSKTRGWQKEDILRQLSDAQERISSDDAAVSKDAIEKYTRPGKDTDGKELSVPIPNTMTILVRSMITLFQEMQ